VVVTGSFTATSESTARTTGRVRIATGGVIDPVAALMKQNG